MMKIIYNRIIPVSGYIAMMLFGVIFARRKYDPLSGTVIRHEAIHDAQARDFAPENKPFKGWRKFAAYLRFYVRYLAYWTKYGYKNNPFECEARLYEDTPDYLKARRRNAYRGFE